jgi:hypothetical protein
MSKYVVGSKILKKEQVLISIFLVSLLLLSSGSMVAFASSSHTVVVKPSGDTTGAKDTAAIQAALNTCTRGDPQCTVQLLSGTYYISSQITVYGFQGSFVGAGQGRTNIVALGSMPSPNPAYNVPCVGYPTCTYTTGTGSGIPYWAGYPGMGPDGTGSPQGSRTPNPWPNLFVFWDGSIAISGMTITDTSPTPTQSWYAPAIDGGGLYTALDAAIEITGLRASATIDHVSIIGAAGDWTGFNMANEAHIEGGMLPSGWTNPEADVIPLTGTFSVNNDVFVNTETGPFANYLTNANVNFCDNTFTAPIASMSAPTYDIAVWDISNTNVVMCGNHGTAIAGTALLVEQGLFKSNLLPSTVYITDNNFQVNEGANGVLVFDFVTPSTLSAVVTGNKVVTDTSCGCYNPEYPVIGAYYADAGPASSSVLVSQNTILDGGSGVNLVTGPNSVVSGNHITGAMVGVMLGCDIAPSECVIPYIIANGVHVVGNVIKNSAQYGIAVIYGSNYNKITGNFITGTASGGYDLYWDLTGTGNVWFGNFCGDHTSSPPGLC